MTTYSNSNYYGDGLLKPKTTMIIVLLIALLSPLALVNAQEIPDDIYHCRDPKNVDKKVSLKCDKYSYEWKISDLDPYYAPYICGDDYILSGQPETFPKEGTWEDELEPCLLWSLFYGSLNTRPPTMSPTPLASETPTGPTDPPTAEDGEDGDTFNPDTKPTLVPAGPDDSPAQVGPAEPSTPDAAPSVMPVIPTEPPTSAPSPSPTKMDPTSLRIDAFTMTLSWPPSVDLSSFNGIDRLELYDITLQHLGTSLRAELNGVPIDEIELNMQTALVSDSFTTSTAQAGGSSRTWTELVSGTVQFGIPAPIESSTLQNLVIDIFSGNAMDVYEHRLRLADDEALKEVAKASLGLEDLDASNDDGDVVDRDGDAGAAEDEGLTWSPLLVAIVICVSIGVIMACAFAYILLYHGRNRQAKDQPDIGTREFPDLQTDPTPPSDGDLGGEDNHYAPKQEEYQVQGYPSSLPPPDGIVTNADQNLAQPYLLNPVASDAGSSLRGDGDTFYDMESQAPSLYSYQEETSHHWISQKQQQAPVVPPSTSLDGVPSQSSPPRSQSSPSRSTSTSEKGSPSKSTSSGGGLLGGLVGKYMGNSKKNRDESALGGNASEGEDDYGFDREANPSLVDDESLSLRVNTANRNPPHGVDMDDGSLISAGRVGQILGDVHSIQGQESPQNFDDIWDDDDSEDGGLESTKSGLTDPNDEEDIKEVLNISNNSVPLDVKDDASVLDRPFDEERIEQRDIVIPEIPLDRNMALVSSQMKTARIGNNSSLLPPLDDDEVSQLGGDDDLGEVQDVAAKTLQAIEKNDGAEGKGEPAAEVSLETAVAVASEIATSEEAEPEPAAQSQVEEDESVEDYDHHTTNQIQDDTTHGGRSSVMDDKSAAGDSYGFGDAEDSYGFVHQKYYHSKSKPEATRKPTPNDGDDDDVKLALPHNLTQQRLVVDSVPGADVVLSSSGSGDDQSVEAVSVGSGSSSGGSSAKDNGKKSKSFAAKTRQVAKGISVRKKKNAGWSGKTSPTTKSAGSASESSQPPRPASPTQSIGSTDSAKFRALMSEPDVFDTPSTPDEIDPKEAVEDMQRKTPAPLLHRLPSDSDDDCYLDDQPLMPFSASVLAARTTYEEKKEDDDKMDDDSGSIVFSLDAVVK